MRNVSTCLVLALLGGALLAACGSSSKSTSSTSTASGPTASTETSTTNGQRGEASGGKSPSGGTSTAAGGSHPQTPTQIVEVCKRLVLAPSALSASTKAKLERSCEKAGGGAGAERQVVHEVCEALAARVPAGPTRERALAICRRAP
jgi:hypothetical protein